MSSVRKEKERQGGMKPLLRVVAVTYQFFRSSTAQLLGTGWGERSLEKQG